MMAAGIRAVTFDYWDTLVRLEGGGAAMRSLQMSMFADALAASGHRPARAALEDAFDRNWERFEASWHANLGPYTAADTTAFVLADLGVDPDLALGERLTATFEHVGRTASLILAPGIGTCLQRLRAAGIRVGIVCDVGLVRAEVLRERLGRFGILEAFDAWSFSDETGWFKPAPGAFTPALDGLGVREGAEAAHVGDNRRTDVAGAHAMGMTAIRYVGFRDASPDEGPEAHHVVDDHRMIPELLGL